MRISTVAIAAGATLLAASPAFAKVTVTNNDSKTHTVIVDYGNKEKDHKLDASKSFDVDCPQKCGFYLHSEGMSRVAGPDAQLVIDQQGELHYKGGQGDMVMPNGKS